MQGCPIRRSESRPCEKLLRLDTMLVRGVTEENDVFMTSLMLVLVVTVQTVDRGSAVMVRRPPGRAVVISRAFFLFFPCNHSVNINIIIFFFRRSKRQRNFSLFYFASQES
jgi:hypothetical protein